MAHPNGDVVTWRMEGAVASVSMRYEPHNLLGNALVVPLFDALQRAVDAGARAVVLKSELRHFSAGADVEIFAALTEPDHSTRPSDGAEERWTPLRILDRIAGLQVPLIAQVHGSCLGGGLELALACDLVIAGRSAKFGCVEMTLGLHPLMGAVQRIAQRAGEARAKEMAMLGRRYDAATLERWNVINLVVDDDGLEAAALSVATELAAGPSVAHAATKQLCAVSIDEGVRAADIAMDAIQRPIWMSEDVRIGLASFLESGPGHARFVGR